MFEVSGKKGHSVKTRRMWRPHAIELLVVISEVSSFKVAADARDIAPSEGR